MKGAAWRVRWALKLVCTGLLFPVMAGAVDWGEEQTSENPCQFEAVASPIELMEAVERALCRDPGTRQAWADVKLQAAQVSISKAAYLPNLNLSVGVAKADNRTVIPDFRELSYRVQTTTRDAALGLSWTLFDFGVREAKLNGARQLLIAANATKESILQSVFASTAQRYYQVLSAEGALNARKQAERAAKENFLAAEARHKAGAGGLSDKLQAQTTHAQATLDRVRAEGEWKSERGALAIAIGMPADTALTLDANNASGPTSRFEQSIRELMREAEQSHPSLLAARAQLLAAREHVAEARAEGRPAVVLTAKLNRAPQVGAYPSEMYVQNKSIGLQLKVPLLDGVGHAYRVSAARAQEEARAAELSKVEQQVAMDVWKSYQELETETADVQAAGEFFQAATQSYQVAQGRYKAGVGTMIELLNAQSAVANATQQQVQALSNWRIARLKLALGLGKLGFWVRK
jgi:outer membrane protein